MVDNNNNQGDKFAKNSITLAVIALILIIIGYLYYHFVPPTTPAPNTVPSTPAVEPQVDITAPVSNNSEVEVR